MPKSTLVKTLLESFCWSIFVLAVGILGFACYSNLFQMILRNRGPQSLLLRWRGCSWFQPSSRDAASLLNSSQQFFLFFHKLLWSSCSRWPFCIRYTHKMSSYWTSSYKTSNYRISSLPNFQIIIISQKSYSFADPDLQRSFCWNRIGIPNTWTKVCFVNGF
jgi:hypothetical protein